MIPSVLVGAENSFVHSIGEIFQPLLKFVADVLAFFYAVIPNYPIDVALLTIVIMALLTPLTVKSTKNMAAMQALGPEMKKLQQKYKGAENRAQLNEEMMKLYKEHNVNPASGCLPMLLQFPAFIILYNVIRGITNTVPKGASLPYAPFTCHQASCAAPRYLGQSSKMYKDIVASHGQLNAFGINFADRLLSHHSSVWVAVPFLLLVVAAVGLQYLQMARLNKRNPQVAQANPQAAAMQKYLPLIFGIIYLNVAAILNVYFVVSSAIRIATQEVLFRRGIVPGPPAPTPAPGGKATGKGAAPPGKSAQEKSLPRPGRPATGDGAPRRAAQANGKAGAGEGGKKPVTDGAGEAEANGRRPAQASGPRQGGRPARGPSAANRGGAARSSGKSPDGEAAGAKGGAKPHPRSKAKRLRKAR